MKINKIREIEDKEHCSYKRTSQLLSLRVREKLSRKYEITHNLNFPNPKRPVKATNQPIAGYFPIQRTDKERQSITSYFPIPNEDKPTNQSPNHHLFNNPKRRRTNQPIAQSPIIFPNLKRSQRKTTNQPIAIFPIQLFPDPEALYSYAILRNQSQ